MAALIYVSYQHWKVKIFVGIFTYVFLRLQHETFCVPIRILRDIVTRLFKPHKTGTVPGRPGLMVSLFYDIVTDPELPPPSYSKERRRSSCTRGRDPDEILKNLKAVKGELGRTMSLSGEKRALRREYWNL